jgi:ATP-dependent helicase/nuclease subunit A
MTVATRAAGLSDADGRRLIHDALDETLVVEAAAGTGKTTELVTRIVRMISEGRAAVREIVAVTFTEKAAGELKLRLRQRLEESRRQAGSPEVARRLDEAVQNLEEAHVSTIHGFCADLLRERPVEARVDPLFRVLTEGQASRIFNAAFDAWFQICLDAPSEGVRRSLRRPSRAFRPGDVDEDGPMERLRRAGFELTQWRDFRAPWTREPFDRRVWIERIVRLVRVLAQASDGASYAGDNLSIDTEPVRRLARQLAGIDVAALDERDLDGLEAQLVELQRNRDFKKARKGSGPTYAKGMPRAQVLAARDALVEGLNEFQLRADADLAALLHAELQDAVAGYETLKAREGALDFLDLLLKARDLVRDNAVVRAHFQRRFARLFVDEFQDTDPLQAELLLLLASGDPTETAWAAVTPVPGKLFIVGDPKQSIYRFRRADVQTYRRVCDLLVTRGARFVELRRSFRSVPNIQRVVNAAFAPIMDGSTDTGQASYVPLEAVRPDEPAQPSVVVLPVPAPFSYRFVTARAIEQSLPDAVGAYVEWLVRHSGWTVSDRRSGERVRLEARHVCLLFRRFVSYGEDVTRPYVEALEARGITHLLVGGKAFHDREEIETLRAALRAIEWPDDQLSVFATLRGALFAIGDEELLQYHHAHRRFHPFATVETLAPALAPIAEALAVLARLHRLRNRRTAAETIAALLAETRAHVGFVLRPGGEQVLANVLHVAELARQYELDGGLSFRGFVDLLHEAAAGGSGAEAPILEEASDGVRVMTVHKAKGLEFPVVVLADMSARLAPTEPNRYVDAMRERCAMRLGGWSPKDLNDQRALELLREEREGERVAYVAATRARDLLVVPAIGDAPWDDGWVSPLNAAIYPRDDARRHANAGAGCPPFASKDSVLERPDGDPASRSTVCPGEHRVGDPPEAASVVWWSPEPDVLALGALPPFGLRRDDLIVKDVDLTVPHRYLDDYRRWLSSLQSAVAAASQPTLIVRTATEVAARETAACVDATDANDTARRQAAPSGAVAIERLDADASRPAGARFGSLVHALLAEAPFATAAGAHGEADAVASLARLARAHARVLGADEGEVDAAMRTVRAAFSCPTLRAAARAAETGRCFRETPITLSLGDEIVEGVIDLAYEDDSGFVVVDFKTDRPAGEALDRYRRQVALYVTALARATGRPARGVLLQI